MELLCSSSRDGAGCSVQCGDMVATYYTGAWHRAKYITMLPQGYATLSLVDTGISVNLPLQQVSAQLHLMRAICSMLYMQATTICTLFQSNIPIPIITLTIHAILFNFHISLRLHSVYYFKYCFAAIFDCF